MSAFQPPGQTYHDPASLARAATVGLALSGGVQLVAGFFVVSRLRAGESLTFSVSGQGTFAGPDGFRAFQWASLVVSTLTYVAWLAWQYRVHTNARVTAPAEVPTSPGWGVLCWLVPLVNFVKPFVVMREIRRASVADPSHGRWIIGLWWTCWIAPVVLGVPVAVRVVSDMLEALHRSSAPQLLFFELDAASLRLVVVVQLSMILAAVLAMVLIREISKGQISMRATGGSAASVPVRPDVG